MQPIQDSKKIARQSLFYLVSLFSDSAVRNLYRWSRGRKQCKKIKQSDLIIVSYAKSGRTWLRVMLSKYFQLHYSLDELEMLEFDNLHRKKHGIPKILFTHDHYAAYFSGNHDTKADYYMKPVILLVRDPRDVVVSTFFHTRYRASKQKMKWNAPDDYNNEMSMYEFIQKRLPQVIDMMNQWEAELHKMLRGLLVRYEDLRTDPERQFSKIISFIDIPIINELINETTEYAAFANMKKRAENQGIQDSEQRLTPANPDNPDSAKIRRAKIGGYRDYLTDKQIIEIDRIVTTSLSHTFGYH